MALCVAVDFDGNDWAALYADPDDAVNIFGAAAVDVVDMPRFTNGAGGATAAVDFLPYYDDRAKYGKSYVQWTTGTVVTANVNIGYNAVSTWTLGANVVPTGNYVAVFWAYRGGGNNNTFRMIVQRDSATTVATGSSQTISSTAWTKFTVSFSFTASVGDDKLYLMLQRTSGDGTTQDILVTGPMIVAGTTAPTWFNCGAASLEEPITDRVMDGRWGLGFVRPYQQIAPVGKADFKLTNTDKEFSPEYVSGDRSGSLYPGKLMQIGDPDYGIWWTGWTDEWKPLPGTNKARYTTLRATDTRRFLEGAKVFVPLVAGAANTTHLALITDVMDEIDLPVVGNLSGLDSAVDFQPPSDIGTSDRPPYYFDSNEEGDSALALLADLLTSVQGHFLFNRAGIYVPFSSSAIDATTATVEIDYDWMDADYTFGDRIINTCDVTTVLKKITSGTVTLWELDENIVLAAGETESFRVNFRNLSSGNNGDRQIVGGSGLAAAGWTLASGTVPTHVTVTISETAAQSCLITLVNISGISRTVNAGTITGNKIIALRTITKRYQDATSVASFGERAMMIKSEWIANRQWAKKLAKWMVTRFKDPRGEMRWVKVSGDLHRALLFSASVLTSVRIKDDQTEHNDIYGVIGEAHTVGEGMTNHVGTLYLEPMYDPEIKDVTLP